MFHVCTLISTIIFNLSIGVKLLSIFQLSYLMKHPLSASLQHVRTVGTRNTGDDVMPLDRFGYEASNITTMYLTDRHTIHTNTSDVHISHSSSSCDTSESEAPSSMLSSSMLRSHFDCVTSIITPSSFSLPELTYSTLASPAKILDILLKGTPKDEPKTE